MLKKLRIVFTFLLLIFFVQSSFAQAPKKYNAAEIKLMLKKLNVLGNAMYVAAHPDDENTRLIGYMANEKLYNTSYLAATRGDGGQNLVGSEIRELLGLIRTQELLAARRTDGSKQFFSRANDFGYSKNPEETFNIWDKEQVLSDFVWVIRNNKPDVMITRFPENGGGGHGHHTASAILAREAFVAAADPTRFSEQLEFTEVWQPKRLLFNTHPFFFRRAGIEMDTSALTTLDLGTYNPLLGKSYPEIAALSRSMHKSQGFGSTGSRGIQVEYFDYVAGSRPVSDPFEAIDDSWNRVKGGEKIAYHIQNAINSYMMENPALIVGDLIKAYNELNSLEDIFWKNKKQDEIKAVIEACMGLYLEVKTTEYAYTPGDSIKLSVESINRSDVDAKLTSVSLSGLGTFTLNQKLTNNSPFNQDKVYVLTGKMNFSTPYWLKEKGTLGMYKVADRELRGTPENAPALTANFTITIDGTDLDYVKPIIFKRNDPVDGEVYRPLEITPPVFMNITEQVYVFGSENSKDIEVKVVAGKADISGNLTLDLPKGWKSAPASFDFYLKLKEEEKLFNFEVTPPKGQNVGEVKAKVMIDGKAYNNSIVRIDYDHIPMQTLFPESTAKIVKIDLKKRGQNVGYIKGAGDEIPASLRQVGYNVWEMNDEDITEENLAGLDALILGIRAFNTEKRLKIHQPKLMEYVNNGGTMIVQYNTSHRLVTKDVGPYPLKLSRDRVTVEEAEIRILNKKHPLMNVPNKITEKDFEGWVQERGLYFPNEWDEKYEALLSSNDPGETPKDGGLLVTQYGKGHYIYTGYSWFRELPAGVPGAYRLFTNMISLGNEKGLDEGQKLKVEN
jgi:LmbE family N-acetylglucosaminyl deacetylase